ncbi:MAG TPA: iron-sulfur cluster assembly protein [Thermoplasmata archaeon]|jgi:metal-sulfur cluster biosynthetic enzyme
MPTENDVIEILKEIIDPHSNVSVYEMRLISEIKVGPKSISLTFRPTSSHCPLGYQLALNMKRRLKQIRGVERVEVKVIGHAHEDSINEILAGS